MLVKVEPLWILEKKIQISCLQNLVPVLAEQRVLSNALNVQEVGQFFLILSTLCNVLQDVFHIFQYFQKEGVFSSRLVVPSLQDVSPYWDRKKEQWSILWSLKVTDCPFSLTYLNLHWCSITCPLETSPSGTWSTWATFYHHYLVVLLLFSLGSFCFLQSHLVKHPV